MIETQAAVRLLWGARVVLRPYGEGFGEEELRRVYAWSRDEEILRLSGGAPIHLAYEQFVEEFWQQRRRERRRRMLYGIFVQSGALIGRVGCFAIDHRRRQGELGIVIGDRRYWGRGYGPDALKTFLRYLFGELGFRRIYLYTGVDNQRAQRAFAKVGFRSLGVVRRLFSDYSAREDVHMQIYPRDLEAGPPSDRP